MTLFVRSRQFWYQSRIVDLDSQSGSITRPKSTINYIQYSWKMEADWCEVELTLVEAQIIKDYFIADLLLFLSYLLEGFFYYFIFRLLVWWWGMWNIVGISQHVKPWEVSLALCNHHSSSEKLGNAIIYVWHMKPGWSGVYVLSCENLHSWFRMCQRR